VSIIAWIILGLVAGWLAGQFMRGGGYGLIGDIVLGIIGAIVGGFLSSARGDRHRHRPRGHGSPISSLRTRT
jgi:uncharacterized membrane protein YeaQ/YmgE (transglycosylase-associated protein family)